MTIQLEIPELYLVLYNFIKPDRALRVTSYKVPPNVTQYGF